MCLIILYPTEVEPNLYLFIPEVVNPTSLKRKNAIEDGKKLKNQRLIETQSSIENISTPKSHQNKSTNPVDSRF